MPPGPAPQAFHWTPSPCPPSEFSRWKFTSKALSGSTYYVLSLVPAPPTPSSSVGSRTEAPASPHLPGARGPPPPRGRPPRKERGPPVTPAHLSPLSPGSRHICDLSFSVVYCAEARPPSQIGAGPASRGPRRPSQPSPEQPPAPRPLSRPRAQQAPSSGGPDTLYGAPGPVSPIVCPCLQPRSCLPHDFIPGDAPVWTGPACCPAEASLSARALGPPGLLIHHFPGPRPPARALGGLGAGAQLASGVGTCRGPVPLAVSPDVRAHASCVLGFAFMGMRARVHVRRGFGEAGVRAGVQTHTHTRRAHPGLSTQARGRPWTSRPGFQASCLLHSCV